MILGKHLRNAFVNTARNVSIFFRGEAKTPRRVYKYNPRLHATFYVVSKEIIRSLLDNPESKTARLFSEETGYAASTIRLVCKLLATEGVLVRTQEFPATYKLTSEEVGRDKLQFLDF